MIAHRPALRRATPSSSIFKVHLRTQQVEDVAIDPSLPPMPRVRNRKSFRAPGVVLCALVVYDMKRKL